ncbi:MAG: endonuclease [Gammaproteobacteria bacterium]
MFTVRIVIFTLFWWPLTVLSDDLPALPQSFSQAKKVAKQIYTDYPITFYCRCDFSEDLQVDFNSCDYHPRRNEKRARRVEWEHIVPAWAFGHDRPCWQEYLCTRQDGSSFKGRSCCSRIDDEFKQMEGDLRNLVPAIGEVNGDRSNFAFADFDGVPDQYGACTFVTNFQDKLAQPPLYTRGFIARVYQR